MLKRLESERNNSTWNKAGDDEPLFILRPSDKNAPEVILHWIGLSARAGANKVKLCAAFELYLEAIGWQKAYPELVKTPD